MVSHERESESGQVNTSVFSAGEGPVIGALLTDLDFPNENEFAAGVVDWAKAKGVTVILFVGGPLHDRSARNAIFRLASDRWLDGVIMSPFLRHLVSAEEMRQFCSRYAPLPVVMGAAGLDEVPHVRVDSFGGMRDVVSHLIESHNLNRIAFITGPEDDIEAQERYQGYETALREHDLTLDPALVVPGDFTEASGANAIRQLLGAQIAFDAVVGANDAMAAGAYATLRAEGLHIPDDVALAGFDDAPEFRAYLPLTTARQSFYELAHQVGDTLVDLVEGSPITNQALMPAPLVIRGSCGCVSDRVAQAAVDRPAREGEGARTDLFEARYRPSEVPVKIWQAFAQDMRDASSGSGSSPAFLRAVRRHIQQFRPQQAGVAGEQQILNRIRHAVVPFLTDKDAIIRAEDLLQQARVLITETAERWSGAELREIKAQASLLRAFDIELGSVQSLDTLVSAIHRTLSELEIRHCYLVRWSGESRERVRLLATVDERNEMSDREFSLRQGPLPEGVVGSEALEPLVILPLTVEDEVLGYAVVNWGPLDGDVYHRLEARFSSVFYRFRLLEDADRARRQAEQALEEIVSTRSIVDHLQRAVDTESVLRITLEELSKVLGAPTAVARLGTREQLLEDLGDLDH
jgi:DNA-binding LacI/PurR family transcriptional regulator